MIHRLLQEERPYNIPVDAAYGVLFGVLGATFLLTVAGLFMKKGSGLQGVLRPTDDFLSARNRYKWPTLALSFFASGMGAWVIYGSPEMGAIRTTSWWGVLGYSSASAAGGWVLMWLGPVVKRKVGEDQGFSAVDFALKRYGRLMQLLVMGVSTFYMFIYVVAELTTIANVYATFVGKSTVGTDSEHYTTKISSIVVIFTWAYTALAGLPASILTDKFQGVTISIFVIMLLIATTTLKSNEVPARRPYSIFMGRGCSSVAERPLCMRKAQGSNPCSSSLTYAVGTEFPELTRFPLRRKRRTRPRARARSSAEPAEMHDKLPTGFHGLVSLSNIGELTQATYETASPCCFAVVVEC